MDEQGKQIWPYCEEMDLIDKELKKELDNELETMEELVEWELSTMSYETLQDFFYAEKIGYYTNNPEAFEDMKIYMQECIDPSVVFHHDVAKKGNE